MSNIVEATTASFKTEVLESLTPVLWISGHHGVGRAGWLRRLIEEIAKEYDGKVKVFKVNTDDNIDIAVKYNILSIPTLGFFRGGEMVDRIIGAVPKKAVVEKIGKL